MLNRIINIKYKYLKTTSPRTNKGLILIELLVLDRNTWNHLIVCKQISSNSFKSKIVSNLGS